VCAVSQAAGATVVPVGSSGGRGLCLRQRVNLYSGASGCGEDAETVAQTAARHPATVCSQKKTAASPVRMRWAHVLDSTAVAPASA
jgi:hypothetical protein